MWWIQRNVFVLTSVLKNRKPNSTQNDLWNAKRTPWNLREFDMMFWFSPLFCIVFSRKPPQFIESCIIYQYVLYIKQFYSWLNRTDFASYIDISKSSLLILMVILCMYFLSVLFNYFICVELVFMFSFISNKFTIYPSFPLFSEHTWNRPFEIPEASNGFRCRFSRTRIVSTQSK